MIIPFFVIKIKEFMNQRMRIVMMIGLNPRDIKRKSNLPKQKKK